MITAKEYIVCLKRNVNYDQFWKEIETETVGLEYIPDRPIKIANNRDISTRQCHYYLSDEEAEILKNDQRIYSVEQPTTYKPFHLARQSGDFTKTTSDSGNFINWGLRRCISPINVYGTGTAVAGDYTYSLDGTGVDVVIQDSGLQVDHPDFQDKTGVSRVQQIDWYSESGLFTIGPNNLKTSSNINVSSNSYITFEKSVNSYNNFSPASLGAALVIGGTDAAIDTLHVGSENNGKSYRLRFLGRSNYQEIVGSGTLKWEVQLLDNNWIEILVLRHDAAATAAWTLNSSTATTSLSMFATASLAGPASIAKSCVLTTNDGGLTWTVNGDSSTNYRATLIEGEWVLEEGLAPEKSILDLGQMLGSPADELLTRFNTPFDFYAFETTTSPMSPFHYRDTDGHGTHCAGIAAGKTYGWAKNARVYSVKVAGLEGGGDSGGIDSPDCFDVIIGWHNNKPVDPATGVKRPTIVNMSWGYGTTFSSITGGNYRGVPWIGTSRRTDYGMIGAFDGFSYRHSVRVGYIDVSIQEMIDAGIHICIAAGNTSMKIDVLGGLDYDNYYTRSNNGGDVYYHRGSSPFDDEAFIVGSIDSTVFNATTEQKSTFSESGPGVNIYAPGSNIMSTTSTTNLYNGGNYPLNSSFRICNISGTSMASPQVCGVGALFLQLEPRLTPAQLRDKIFKTSTSVVYTTGLTDDYTNNRSITNGPNRFLNNPFNSDQTVAISGPISLNAGLN